MMQKIEKYKIAFEILCGDRDWKETFLDNNGDGFTYNEAEDILYQLRTDNVCIKRDLRIENME